MTDQTLQGREQAFYRSISGTTSTWEGDALSAWLAMGIPDQGNFNGNYIKYLQTLLNSDLNDLSGLIALRRERFGNDYPELGGVIGLTAWLKADQIPVGAVASYTDPLGITYTQGTESAQPTNTADQIGGRKALVFDGTADTLELSSGLYDLANGPSTVFIVSKMDSNTAAYRIINMTVAGPSSRYSIATAATAGQVEFYNGLFASRLIFASGVDKTSSNIFRFRRSGTTQAASANGGTESSNTSATDEASINAGFIGSFNGSSIYYGGAIAEILIYDRSLSASEILAVETYLSNYYGIALA